MQFPSSLSTEEKFQSLSERLKYLARDTNSARLYTDQNVKSANLKLNLSLVLSKIILELHFIDRSKKVFEKIIDEYNKVNKTNLSFEDFEKLNWIRIIAGEAIMPRLINHFVWQLVYHEKEGKAIEIPEDKNDLIRCLQIYSERCFQDSRLTISRIELENVLSKFALIELTVDFLLEIKVIGFDSKTDVYYWKGGEYSRHLKNEIASTLWLLEGGENATDIEFRRYLKLNEGAEIWIDDLEAFLNHKNTKKISELAISFLANEKDLLKSDAEFTKIWLDSENYMHIDIMAEIPFVELNYNTAYDFIESVNYHKWRLHDIFDYQITRSFCHSLLRIIVLCEPKHPTPYQSVLKILKDTSRPSLLWTLYSDIKREFPFVIPYLLTDSELIPIAFKLIDEIEIDKALLSEQSNNDRKFEESLETKNHLWFEMFDFTLEQLASTPFDNKEIGELLAKILIDLAENVFSVNSNNSNSIIRHNALRKRYDEVLKKLSNKRIANANTYPSAPIKPRVAGSLLPHIINYIERKFQATNPNHTDFLHLKSGLTDLSIEVLRLSNLRISEGEFSKEQKETNESKISDLVSLLQKYLSEFYSQINIDVQVYNKLGTEKRKAKRGVNEFGFEIIDWGYLYLHFEENGVLQNLTDSFISALNFNTSDNKYDKQNKEQFEKIKLYLKSLMLGYISINQKRDLLEIDGLPVKTTLDKLEKWIRDFSLMYSIEDIPHSKIDVFNEMFSVFGYDMYYQHLTSLLYRSINYFNGKEQIKFVQEFFVHSTDTGRMLTAINILDSQELRDIISKRISEVKIDDFIENSLTTTELRYALVEAVNSANHWELAKPLIERIQNHSKRIKHNDEQANYFLFEVNLLLAFKGKDFKKLSELQIPKDEFQHQRGNKKAENIKKFFIALYKIYNDKNYDEAIFILKSLLTDEAKNIRYAFHLYRAETLKAIGSMNQVLLNQAYQNWENFVSNLTDEERKGLFELGEQIASNNLYFFTASKDTFRFDQTVNKLSKRYLFDEEIIPTVYKFYVERDLHELAFDYIKKAKLYLSDSGIPLNTIIQTIVDNSITSHLLEKLKMSFVQINGEITAKDLPLITPNKINNKRNLSEFILHEVVQASKILLDKIHGIKKNPEEDRYNDLFLATLRLRFQIWGWSIHDQARKGSSPTGINAGETDITIESGNITIALFEALILRGKDKTKTEKHVLKSFSYATNLDKYYMIIYFTGAITDFDTTWKSYKENVSASAFNTNFTFNIAKDFEDLSSKFDDVNHLKIARSIHGKGIEMFHIMINLAE